MGGVEEGVVDRGVVAAQAVLRAQARGQGGAGWVEGIGDGRRQRLNSRRGQG